MKTIALMKMLKPSEYKKLDERIAQHRRTTLQALYAALSKHIRGKYSEGNPDKKRLYKQVYGKAYKASKDYLLRNELRLLSELLQEFVLENYQKKKYKEKALAADIDLARAFLERGENELFYRHFQSLHKEQLCKKEYRALVELEELYMQYIYAEAKHTQDYYREYSAFLYGHLQHIEKAARELYLNAERQLLSVQTALQYLGAGADPSLPASPFLPRKAGEEQENKLFDFLEAVKQGQKTGSDAEQAIAVALSLYEQLADLRPGYALLVLGLKNNLALHQRRAGKYQEALKLYNELLEQMERMSLPTQWLSLLINASTTALYLDKPELLLAYFERFRESLEQQEHLATHFYQLLLLAYLQCEKYKEAKALLAHCADKVEPQQAAYCLLLEAFLAEAKADLPKCRRALAELLSLAMPNNLLFQQLQTLARVFSEYIKFLPRLEAAKADIFYNYMREALKEDFSFNTLCWKYALQRVNRYREHKEEELL